MTNPTNTVNAKALVKIVRKYAKANQWCSDAETLLSNRLGLVMDDERDVRLAKGVDQPTLNPEAVRNVLDYASRNYTDDGVTAAVREIRELIGTAPAAANGSGSYTVTWTAVVTDADLRRSGWTGNGSPETYARGLLLSGANRFEFTHTAR